MNSIIPTALGAMQDAHARLARTASDVAQTGARDIARSVVALRQAETAHAASAAVIRTANDMTGRLLDILA